MESGIVMLETEVYKKLPFLYSTNDQWTKV